MATSRPSRLPKPRAVSSGFRDCDSGTGTAGSNTSSGSSYVSSNLSSLPSSSLSSTSGNLSTGSSTTSPATFKDRIKRFFHIPNRHGSTRIPQHKGLPNGTATRPAPPPAKLPSPPSHDLDRSKVNKVKVRIKEPNSKDKKKEKKCESKKDSKAPEERDKTSWYRRADVKFVPHRRSKLDKQKKLSQQVANVGPADYNFDETISSLRYANRAKNIKNKARINEDPKDALLRQFQKEIEELKKQLEDGGGGVEGSDEVSGESETDSEGEVLPDGTKKRRKKKRGGRGISKEKMSEIQSQIEQDRKKLETQKDMAEEEKRKVEEDLEEKEAELKKAEEEQQQLNNRLTAIEKKIIVGGENLLEKAEEQERLLEESAKELEDRRMKAEDLRKALEEKEQERMDIEEKYSSLQEEVTGKTKKLKKVWTMLMSAKSEIADLQQEHQREMEGLLENVRQLSRELRLQMVIIDNFIPPEYQEMIEQYVHWNEDIGEWQLKCVAYTGNNMRKQTPMPDKDNDKYKEPDLSHVYLAYTAEGAEEALRPKTGKKSSRPKTASRPKSSRKKRRDPDINSVLG